MSSEDNTPIFKLPKWAKKPDLSSQKQFSLEVLKNGEIISNHQVMEKSSYTFGRNPTLSDIIMEHPSISRQHAALVHHEEGFVYLIDLNSAHGTFVNGDKLAPNKPKHLKDQDEVKFGASTRTYIFREMREKKRKSRWEDEEETKETSKSNSKLNSVRCAHLLVKHSGSRNPTSWRNKSITITKTKEEARKELQEYREQITSGKTDLQTLAEEKSDCTSARKRGDLGVFKRGTMQPPFEKAAFALQVGELSQIVDSDSGLHLILRLE